MKSLSKQMAQKAEKEAVKSYAMRNRKGQAVGIIAGTVAGLFGLFFIIFAYLFGISSLNPGSFFTAGSAEQNATNLLRANLTAGAAQFGGTFPTVMLVLGAVLIISGIVIFIVYINRIRVAGGAGGGSVL